MSNKRFVTLFDIARAHANAKLQCPRCTHSCILTSQELFARLPMTIRIDHAGQRLRCSSCGEKGGLITPVPVGVGTTWHRLTEAEARILLKAGLQLLPASVAHAIGNSTDPRIPAYDMGARVMMENFQRTRHEIYRA